jgi:hypothetical protein
MLDQGIARLEILNIYLSHPKYPRTHKINMKLELILGLLVVVQAGQRCHNPNDAQYCPHLKCCDVLGQCS